MRTNRHKAQPACGYGAREGAPSTLGAVRANSCLAVCSLALALVSLGPGEAGSQSLNEALTSAFSGNPGLDAERARQRADEESIKLERAKGLPNLSLDAYTGGEHSRLNSSSRTTKLDPDGYSVTLTQPLFRGFQTLNGTRRVKAEARAGESQLHGREQSVLLDAATAYMDVVRDRKIVKLRRDNVRFLNGELKASRARRKAGDLSKTDVAQARTRLFGGKADLAQAEADVEASEASFEAIIGRRPGALAAPRMPPGLPPSLEAALGVAKSANPAIVGALHQQEAARRAKREAYGALLPTVSLELSHGIDRNTSALIDREEVSSLFVRMKMPLYRGGELRSRVRQTRARETGAIYEVTDSRRRTRANVINAWKQLHAARARIRAARQQVKAAREALKGVRIEVKVGERALFEVLDAQRELVNGEVALARAQNDHVVSGYTLLAATGRLTASYLNLPVDYPDLDDAVRRERLFANEGTPKEASAYPRLFAPAETRAEDRVDVRVLEPAASQEAAQAQWAMSVTEMPVSDTARLATAAIPPRTTLRSVKSDDETYWGMSR